MRQAIKTNSEHPSPQPNFSSKVLEKTIAKLHRAIDQQPYLASRGLDEEKRTLDKVRANLKRTK